MPRLHGVFKFFNSVSITQNRWTIRGLQIWVIFAIIGFNTSVLTPFYPLSLLFPNDQMYIIQVGRTIRICKIQLLEMVMALSPPSPSALLLHADLHPSAHTWSSLLGSSFSFFCSTSHFLKYHMHYCLLSILFTVSISLLECKFYEGRVLGLNYWSIPST